MMCRRSIERHGSGMADQTDASTLENGSITSEDQDDAQQSITSGDTASDTNSAVTTKSSSGLEHNGPFYPHQNEFASHFPSRNHFRNERK